MKRTFPRLTLQHSSKCFTLLCLQFTVCLTLLAQNFQSKYWYIGDKQIDLANYTSPTITPLDGNPPRAKYVSSGAYWTNGTSYQNELTVSDDVNSTNNGYMKVYQYDPTPTTGGLIETNLYEIRNGPCGADGTCTTIPGTELAIIPKPGSECGSYYVLYSYTYQGVGAVQTSLEKFHYAEYNTDINIGLVSNGNNIHELVLLNQGLLDVFPAAFAVSKRNATTGNRFLYAVTPYRQGPSTPTLTRLYKYLISSTGIQEVDLTPTLANNYIEFQGVIAPSEVELSHDQTLLAFARKNFSNFPTNTDLVIVKLDASGNLLNGSLSNVLTYDLPSQSTNSNGDSYTGLEFMPNNQTLYINNAGDGIRPFTLNNNQLGSFVFTSDLYSNSQLELRYFASGSDDLRICAVKDGSQSNFEIGYINISTNAMAQNNGLNNFYYQQSQFQNVGGIFTLQDQVDGEDYSTWSTANLNAVCCARANTTAYGTVNAVTRSNSPGANQFNNTNGDVIIQNEFIVPAGVVCTLSNLTMRFHPGARLRIMPTGQLWLQNNAQLTGLACGTTWKGVRILGNSTLPHSLANQGYLNIQGNSTISHAETGVATCDIENNFASSGGFVQTDFALFKNNRRDAYIAPYGNAGMLSFNFFDRTQFTFDDNYRFGATLDNRVLLNTVYRVNFRGCTFANDATLAYMQASIFNNKAGVYAVDSWFIVDRKTTTTPSIFRNLYDGVWAGFLFTNQPYTVTNSQFTQNQRGIYSGAVNNFTITNNYFTVGNNENFLTNTGLFINTGTGFTVSDNTFEGLGFATGTLPTSFGVVVKNTCTTTACSDNAIYRNAFRNLFFANQSEGRNRNNSDAVSIGLTYFCNTHSGNQYDIRVLRDTALGNVNRQGIRLDHFTGTYPTAPISVQNSFSQNLPYPPTSPWYDIHLDPSVYTVNGTPYTYVSNVRYVPQTGVFNTYPYQSPQPSSIPIVNYSVTGALKNCTVANPFGTTSMSIGQMLSDNGFGANNYETSKENYLTAKYLYQLLIDEGNKEALITEIDYNWGSDAWELRNELLARSPNLSGDVLLRAVQKNVLPDALLFEVLYANLHLLKLSDFTLKLETALPNPLPQYMIDILRLSTEPSSYRTILESQMLTALGEMTAFYQSVNRAVLQDTSGNNSILPALLNDVPLKEAKLDLANFYYRAGNISDGDLALTEYKNIALQEGISHLPEGEFYDRLLSKKKILDSLTINDLNYLESVASDSTHFFHVVASHILKQKGILSYDVQPRMPLDLVFKKESLSLVAEKALPDAVLSIYPNPANDYVTLEVTAYISAATEINVDFVDMNGRTVKTLVVNIQYNHKGISNVSVTDLPKGVYHVIAKNGTTVLNTQSFTKR